MRGDSFSLLFTDSFRCLNPPPLGRRWRWVSQEPFLTASGGTGGVVRRHIPKGWETKAGASMRFPLSYFNSYKLLRGASEGDVEGDDGLRTVVHIHCLAELCAEQALLCCEHFEIV